MKGTNNLKSLFITRKLTTEMIGKEKNRYEIHLGKHERTDTEIGSDFDLKSPAPESVASYFNIEIKSRNEPELSYDDKQVKQKSNNAVIKNLKPISSHFVRNSYSNLKSLELNQDLNIPSFQKLSSKQLVYTNRSSKMKISKSVTPSTQMPINIKGILSFNSYTLGSFPKIERKGVNPSIPIKRKLVKHKAEGSSNVTSLLGISSPRINQLDFKKINIKNLLKKIQFKNHKNQNEMKQKQTETKCMCLVKYFENLRQ